MSLAVAIWQGPARYSLAVDSTLTTDIARRRETGDKFFVWGEWLGAWTGLMTPARALVEELTNLVPPEDLGVTAIEDVLLRAHRAVLPHCGASSPDRLPSTGANLLLVGPLGIVRMGSFGDLVWTRGEPTVWDASGAGEDYALGWLDALEAQRGSVYLGDAQDVVLRVCKRFPSVGAPVTYRARLLGGWV